MILRGLTVTGPRALEVGAELSSRVAEDANWYGTLAECLRESHVEAENQHRLHISRQESGHRGSTVCVRILLRPKTVAVGSPFNISCTCLGGSQAKWIRLLT